MGQVAPDLAFQGQHRAALGRPQVEAGLPKVLRTAAGEPRQASLEVAACSPSASALVLALARALACLDPVASDLRHKVLGLPVGKRQGEAHQAEKNLETGEAQTRLSLEHSRNMRPHKARWDSWAGSYRC